MSAILGLMVNGATGETRTCLCGCGTVLKTPGASYARGHFRRGPAGERLTVLPGPSAGDEEILLDPVGPVYSGDAGPGVVPGEIPGRSDESAGPSSPGAGREAPEEDEPPAHVGPRPAPPSRPRTGPVRVTAAVRRDIAAKVAVMLTVPGAVWRARDPLCGGVFMDQVPEIGAALTDAVCQSNALVEFFTSTGGGFIIYLQVFAALQPVAMMVFAHHIAHSIDAEPPAGVEYDASQLAA